MSDEKTLPDDYFEKLDNHLVEYAAKENHILLATYVYSKMMCNRYQCIGTTLEIITDLFFPDYDKRCRKVNEFKKAFEMLEEGITFTIHDEEILLDYVAFDEPKIEDLKRAGYTQPLWFYVSETDLQNSFMMLKYSELNYLLDCVKENNKLISSNRSKINSVDLLCLFLIIKLFYCRNMNYNGYKYNYKPRPVYFSTNTLEEKLNMSGKTISKYADFLVSIGMLTINPGNFKERKATEYSIVEKWKDETWQKERMASMEPHDSAASAEQETSINILSPEMLNNNLGDFIDKAENIESLLREFHFCKDRDYFISQSSALQKEYKWCTDYIKASRSLLYIPQSCRRIINYYQPTIDEFADIISQLTEESA